MWAADYWEEMAEAEILASGGRGLYPSELKRTCSICRAPTPAKSRSCRHHHEARMAGKPLRWRMVVVPRETAQLRATGATSGPRSSSGSKEGRGQL